MFYSICYCTCKESDVNWDTRPCSFLLSPFVYVYRYNSLPQTYQIQIQFKFKLPRGKHGSSTPLELSRVSLSLAVLSYAEHISLTTSSSLPSEVTLTISRSTESSELPSTLSNIKECSDGGHSSCRSLDDTDRYAHELLGDGSDNELSKTNELSKRMIRVKPRKGCSDETGQ